MEHGIQFGRPTLSLSIANGRVLGVIASRPVEELKDVDTALPRAPRRPVDPAQASARGKQAED
jgi:hypothetical protein